MEQNAPQEKQWYVLRDFKKWNAKTPAWQLLPTLGIECFTPMHWVVNTRGGKRVRQHLPIIPNLLFAHAWRADLDPIVAQTDSLQYQFRRGAGPAAPMTVRTADMERFIAATASDPSPLYYTPEELTPDMLGRSIRVSGGPLDGYSGNLLKIRGTRKRRLLVEIPGLLAAAVEVAPDFIQLV